MPHIHVMHACSYHYNSHCRNLSCLSHIHTHTHTHCVSSDDVDKEAVQQMFDEYDSAKTGFINVGDLERLLVDRGLAPTKRISRGPSSTG